MQYEQDPNKLEIYNELAKRRILTGILQYDPKKQVYTFRYQLDYLRSKSAIPLGPEFPVKRIEFKSKKQQLFATFLDRIPDKRNPAYVEYCESQGISPEEDNNIILLTTIGRRGPSTFIFEPVFIEIGSVAQDLKQFRSELSLSYWDFAQAFNFPELTVMNVEKGITKDANIIRLIHAFLTYPELALQQLELTGKKVHRNTRTKLHRYFTSRVSDQHI